jgi:hypothetical protein
MTSSYDRPSICQVQIGPCRGDKQGPAPTIQKCHIRLSAFRKLVRNNLQKLKKWFYFSCFFEFVFRKIEFCVNPGHLVDSFGTPPWPPELKISVITSYLATILCMWSDHNRIRPHAKYCYRERPGSRSETAFDHFVRSPADNWGHTRWPISHHPTVRFGCNLACGRIMA